jgi:hypothetical protein
MRTFPSSWRVRRAIAGLFLLATIVFVDGCKSTKKTTLTGKVSYNGKPVTGGDITLFPTDDKANPVSINISPSGTYEFFGPPIGDMKVTISTDSLRNQQGGAYQMPQGMNQKPPEGKDENKFSDVMSGTNMPKYVPIPQIYNDKKTTPLTVTINPGANTKDFDLTESGK